ncbi:MAG TPA: hypothetical protein PKW95_12230 [bacterium]|nr:hypothetical protein [bacterium]
MSEIINGGPAPLFIEPAAESLIRPQQERTSLEPARRDRTGVARRRQDTVSTHAESRRRAARSTSGTATAVAETTTERTSRTASPWKEQIPPGAIFYDEMADITAGINQPGMLVSKRV